MNKSISPALINVCLEEDFNKLCRSIVVIVTKKYKRQLRHSIDYIPKVFWAFCIDVCTWVCLLTYIYIYTHILLITYTHTCAYEKERKKWQITNMSIPYFRLMLFILSTMHKYFIIMKSSVSNSLTSSFQNQEHKILVNYLNLNLGIERIITFIVM